MRFLHVSVSIDCAQYPQLWQFLQSPKLCFFESTPFNFSFVAQWQTKQLLFWAQDRVHVSLKHNISSVVFIVFECFGALRLCRRSEYKSVSL